MGHHAQVTALAGMLDEASAAAYAAGTAIARRTDALDRAIASLNPGGWGLAQFSPDALHAPGGAFLVIRHRKRLTTSPGTEDCLKVGELASDSAEARGIAAAAASGFRSFRGCWMLPLDGALVARHRVLGRLAGLAAMILAHPEWGAAIAGWAAEARALVAARRTADAAEAGMLHVGSETSAGPSARGIPGSPR